MEFRRGFKSECERLALELRAELSIAAADRLDPHALAEHLAIPVISLAGFRAKCPSAFTQLVVNDRESFSAMTIFCGPRRMIVYNPSHPPGRHTNSVAHELSHVLLEHDSGPVREDGGDRRWNPAEEAQADWLAGTLLAPREGILAVMYRLGDIGDAARHFGISEQLMRWRLNHTGAARQMQRARSRARAA
jgi:Zn-dependent peptidase ImmA (M78 family)